MALFVLSHWFFVGKAAFNFVEVIDEMISIKKMKHTEYHASRLFRYMNEGKKFKWFKFASDSERNAD